MANVAAGGLRNRVIIHLARTVPDMCTTGIGPGQPMRNVITSVRVGAHRSIAASEQPPVVLRNR